MSIDPFISNKSRLPIMIYLDKNPMPRTKASGKDLQKSTEIRTLRGLRVDDLYSPICFMNCPTAQLCWVQFFIQPTKDNHVDEKSIYMTNVLDKGLVFFNFWEVDEIWQSVSVWKLVILTKIDINLI